MKKFVLLFTIFSLLVSLSGCKAKKEELMLQLEIVGEGTVIPDPDRDYYTKGEIVRITAVPNDNYIFTEYVINGKSYKENPVEVQLIENTKVKVVFYRKDDYRSIKVNIQGDGTVERLPEKDFYEKGETVTLIARPGLNWYFDHWEGDLSGSSSNATITLDTNKDVTAVFKAYPNYYVLTCLTVGEGTVTRSPLKTAFSSEEMVTVTAIPKAGWYFDHWEGDLSGTEPTVTMQLKKDTTVIAVFKEKENHIFIQVIGGGKVIKTPDKSSYRTGETVTLTAVPDDGWLFDYWGGYLQGKSKSQTVTVTEDVNITAYFRDKVNITLNKTDTGWPVIVSYPTQVSVGSTLSITLNWVYSSGGNTYYLRTDGVSISPNYSYNLSSVSLKDGNASQTITIENVHDDLNIFVNIGEYFKIDTVAYRPDGGVLNVTITKTPAPYHTVYGISGLYKKGDVVVFEAPMLTVAHKFWYWGNELGGISNNPSPPYTVYKSVTIEAYYDRI